MLWATFDKEALWVFTIHCISYLSRHQLTDFVHICKSLEKHMKVNFSLTIFCENKS